MQETTAAKLPLLKYLLTTFFIALLLYFGKTLFVPLFFGLLIAMIMYPVCKWLEAHSWPKSLAITACIGIVSLLLLGLLALLVWQATLFVDEAPLILHKAAVSLAELSGWLQVKTGVALNIQQDWEQGVIGNVGTLVKTVFQSITGALFMLFITPVFTVLFMYHRKVFVQFLRLVVPQAYRQQTDAAMVEVIHTYFNYIKGMVLVYLMVGTLNSVGLFVLGVNNPILFGMLCAIMTIIPYVGIVVSALLPISMAWLQTGNICYPIGVVAIFSVVQYLEANVIFPKVVGKQLNVSTMAMLVAIIVGGIIWGVAGMVLFIPFVAILKIMADNIPDWKPLQILLSRK